MKYVIIGNGAAGINAAEAIRHLDLKGSITIVTDEAAAPYCRPMISMLLDGSTTPDKLLIRSAHFYRYLNIKSVSGDLVTGIDVDNRSVFTERKEVFPFDKLLIATGANPKYVSAKGRGLKNIFFMRTQDHVHQMLKALPSVKKALVLGGGLVGVKAAYGLLCRGLSVCMIIGSDYPLSMQVDKEAGKMILDELLGHGLEVKTGADVVGFEGKERVKGVHLSDGEIIFGDMVVLGKGVLPALSSIPRDQIKVDRGLLVNQHMETSIPGVFAAGDVAESRDIVHKAPRINAIWPEAVNQGRIAGTNMAGRKVGYQGGLGRNVIRIFNLDIMTGGLINPPLDSQYEVLNYYNPRSKTYRKLVFRQDRLVGMIMVNDTEQGGILVSLIRNETMIRIPREAILEPSFNYKRLMM